MAVSTLRAIFYVDSTISGIAATGSNAESPLHCCPIHDFHKFHISMAPAVNNIFYSYLCHYARHSLWVLHNCDVLHCMQWQSHSYAVSPPVDSITK